MNNSIKNFILNWILPIIIAVVIVTLINKFLFFNVEVPTLSMYPTIEAGDRLLVSRVYNPEKLKTGDIIVFNSNYDENKLVKRLIGTPGDKVEIDSKGKVSVNGKELKEDYLNNTGGNNGKTYNVPKDSYFYLGDNRENSLDSRYWENPYAKSSEILGKAQFTFWPFNRIGKLK